MDEANRNIFSGCRGHQDRCGAVLQGDLGGGGARGGGEEDAHLVGGEA